MSGGFDVSFGPPHPPDGTLQTDVAWLAEMWEMLRDGGVWGVPRSGLIFEKREAERVLAVTARMPWMSAMPCSAAELDEQQRDEVEGIRARLEQVGITVIDETREDDNG